jgi:hypothetical protein
MAIPSPNAPCWQRLASGGLSQLKTDNLATQMLIKRMELSRMPAAEKSREIYNYFVKWERGLATEVAQLSRI